MDDESNAADLQSLVDAMCLGTSSKRDLDALSDMLADDPAAQQYYLKYCRMHVELFFCCNEMRLNDSILAGIRSQRNAPSAPSSYVLADSSPFDSSAHVFFSGWPMAYLIATLVTALGLLFFAFTNIAPPGHIAGPAIHDKQLPHPLTPDPQPSIVGRITGMVDCVWEGSGGRAQGSGEDTAQRLAAAATPRGTTESGQQSDLPSPAHRPEGLVGGSGAGGEGGLHLHSAIHLNDRFALRSGLMEITYNTGARVILQGPVTYKVDSAAGGYLSVGKLTARLEKKAETQNLPSPAGTDLKGWSGRGAGGEGGSQRDTDGDHNQPQSALTLALSRKRARGPDSSLPLPPSTFAVTTPSATVTDLGTEFGVEVTSTGVTLAQVFSGVVEVQRGSRNGRRLAETCRLVEGSSATIRPEDGEIHLASRVANPVTFVRRMPRPENHDCGTVAYWRFEEGPANTKVPDQGYLGTRHVSYVKDRSGNGNHLRTQNENNAPVYRTDVPATTIPQTGQPNRGSLEFGPSPEGSPRYLFSYDDSNFSRALNHREFHQWTVEASVKFTELGKHPETFVCWEHFNNDGIGESSLYLQVAQQGVFSARGRDATNKFIILNGVTPLVAGLWYHVAEVGDGKTLSLYLFDPAIGAISSRRHDRICRPRAHRQPLLACGAGNVR